MVPVTAGGKTRRVLRSSVLCDQNCWHTGLSRRLRALAVTLMRPSDRHGLYIIASNPSWFQGCKDNDWLV